MSLTGPRKVYAVFSKLGSLARSNDVKINGYSIGTVYAVEPTSKDVDSIKVTISVTQDVNIPSNSVAYISAGLLVVRILLLKKARLPLT